MTPDTRAVLAAQNNADLYEAVFQARGLGYVRLPFALVARDRPPPFYSGMTVTSPGRVPEVLAQLPDLAARFDGAVGLKDSFCEVDLQANGFRTLFEADWIWKAAGGQDRSDWTRIRTEAELLRWENAWTLAGSATGTRMFPGSILDRDDTVFLGKLQGDGYVAGCIATISTDCLGLSNVFSLGPPDRSYAEATTAVAGIDPRLPVVGYESGSDLAAALQAGFVATGRLRILQADRARF